MISSVLLHTIHIYNIAHQDFRFSSVTGNLGAENRWMESTLGESVASVHKNVSPSMFLHR